MIDDSVSRGLGNSERALESSPRAPAPAAGGPLDALDDLFASPPPRMKLVPRDEAPPPESAPPPAADDAATSLVELVEAFVCLPSGPR